MDETATYFIQLRFTYGWDYFEHGGDESPITYRSLYAAVAALVDHWVGEAHALARGDKPDVLPLTDVRIVRRDGDGDTVEISFGEGE